MNASLVIVASKEKNKAAMNKVNFVDLSLVAY